MKRRTIIVLMMIQASIISAQDHSYNENSQTRGIDTYGERVTLDITPVKTKLFEDRQTALPIVGAIAAPLIDVGISLIKTNIARNAKQYLASYACANSGERFYESSQYVNLPELTITRSIIIPDHATGGDKQTDALNIVLVPELSADKHAFRYRVKLVSMNYSKARTRFSFDYIDVQLDVVFRALTLEGAKQEVANLRAFSFVIPSVKPNTTYDPATLPHSSWLPFPPPPQLTKGVGIYEGTGTYEFLIGVTESNPYKVRAEHKQHVTENSDKTLSALAAEIAELIKTSGK